MTIQELRKQPHLSASGINDYTECSLLYKFSRIDKKPPEFTAESGLPLKGALFVKKTCIALALALLINSAPADAARVTVDRILATVNGEIITQSEFEKYKAMLLMGAQEIPADMEVTFLRSPGTATTPAVPGTPVSPQATNRPSLFKARE